MTGPIDLGGVQATIALANAQSRATLEELVTAAAAHRAGGGHRCREACACVGGKVFDRILGMTADEARRALRLAVAQAAAARAGDGGKGGVP